MTTTRAVLVTGAASGIGLATLHRLQTDGWQAAGIDRENLPDPGLAQHFLADVRDETALRTAVHNAINLVGRLDALVCCAGISGSAAGDGPVSSCTAAAFDTVIGVNLRGTFITASAAWEALAAAGGSVITVSSVLGLTGGGGPFRSHAYIASKGGLIALTRALAAEGRRVGVRANCVAPGLVDTPLASRAASEPVTRSYVADRQQIAGGLLTADSVAAVIAFLCSSDARAITGQILAVDAGWTLDPA